MIDKSQVIRLIDEKIEGTEYFVVSVTISSHNDIHVVLDGDHGVTIDKCIEISRQVEHNLDRESEDFSLEVGSFVLGHPLQLKRQYFKYIDKKIEVILTDGINLKGILKKVDQDSIDIELELTKKKIKEGVEAKRTLLFTEIKETRAMIVF